MSSDDGLLVHRLVLHIGDGLPALRIEDLARAWKLYQRERAALRVVAAAGRVSQRALKYDLLLGGLNDAIAKLGMPAGSPDARAEYRTLVISHAVQHARQTLRRDGQWFDFYDVSATSAPQLSTEQPDPEPPEATEADREQVEGLRAVIRRSEDERALLRAFLELGAEDLTEAERLLGWNPGRAWTIRKRLAAKYPAGLLGRVA